MKNLFDYATKELSQDAFIAWALDNYDAHDCPELAEVSYKFLNFLLAGEMKVEPGTITKANVYKQKNHIDIVFEFWVAKKKYWLAIEDKTYSQEHDQLADYNAYLKNQNGVTIFKRYYKTSFLSNDEIDRVTKAEWKIVDFDEICGFWESEINSENLIINHYANHVCSLADRLLSTTFPDGDDDMESWSAYFRNVAFPYLQAEFGPIAGEGKIFRGHYAHLWARRPGYTDENGPYLEVTQNRDRNERYVFSLRKNDTTLTENETNSLRRIVHFNGFFHDGNNRELLGKHPGAAKDSESFLLLLNQCYKQYNQILIEWETEKARMK